MQMRRLDRSGDLVVQRERRRSRASRVAHRRQRQGDPPHVGSRDRDLDAIRAGPVARRRETAVEQATVVARSPPARVGRGIERRGQKDAQRGHGAQV